MPKIYTLTLVLSLFSVLFLQVRNVNADLAPMDNCPNPVIATAKNPSTISTDLNTKSENATFEVNIGNYYDPSVKKWEIQFECGTANWQTVDASSNSTTITTAKPVERSNNPVGGCEFFSGSHTFQVKGDGTARCRGTYTVRDADSECKLSIDPSTGITPTTTVKVSGENLTVGGQFKLFMDNNDELSTSYLDTPSFKNIQIPKEKLTPTVHKVYLKRYNIFVLPFQDKFGPTLCPRQFDLTPGGPGGVLTNPPGGGAVTTPCIGDGCSSGGGISCPDGSDGFVTAIGCIHTQPKALVEDVLQFATGIGGGLAFMMMLFGAFQMLTSGGNPQNLQGGRDVFQNALIGLLFIIFSILLMKIIGIDILNIPGFS